MSTGPQPIAEGSLVDTPFAHVLVSVERRALSGTLAVWPDDGRKGQDRLLVDRGRVVAGRLLEPAPSLDVGLLPLFQRVRAPYAFYGENLLGDAPEILRGTVHSGALIAASLRAGVREDIVERILAGHGENPLRVAPGAELAELALAPSERAVVELLQADPAPVAQVVAASGDPALARRVLYLLTLTKKLETYEPRARPSREPAPPRPPSGRFSASPAAEAAPSRATPPPPARASVPGAPAGVPRPPDPPQALSPELRARYEAIAEFIVASDEYDHFQLLGIGEAASAEEVASAYAKRVKQFHPDRLGPELAELAPFCQRIFHQLTEAKKTLTDPEARLAHVRAIRAGGGTPAHDRKLSAIVGAAMEFQKADVMIKQRRYDDALAILDRILAIEPDESDYLARKAWTLFLVHPEKSGPRAAEILALVDKALSKNDRHEQAHFTKASLLKRQGDVAAALEHFRQALKANPKNIDAARELRIAEMRSKNRTSHPPTSKSPKSPETSILKKLFGGGGDK